MILQKRYRQCAYLQSDSTLAATREEPVQASTFDHRQEALFPFHLAPALQS